MNAAERALAELAARQRQVFTRADAIAAGLSPSGVLRRVDSGSFVAVGIRTMTFGGATLDWRGRLQAGVLDLGPGSVISAEAAAALHELDGFDEGPTVYLVPRELRNRTTPGVVTSSSSIVPLDRCTVDGLPVASGTRTVVELVGRVSRRQLGNALDSATRKRLTAPGVVDRRLTELGRQGRHGIVDFDAVMAAAGVESWLERQFLRLLDLHGFRRPEIQRTYRRDGVTIARVDFDFDPLPVVVEVGGQRGYLSADERRRQEHRRNELQLLGKLIYFFTSEDVTQQPEYVVRILSDGLGRLAS